MAELEDDLWIAHGKTIHVGNAAAQDERVVVQPEIRSVAEKDLPDFWSQPSFTVFDETNIKPLRRDSRKI